MTSPGGVRDSQRYHALRKLGYSGEESAAGSSMQKFNRLARAKGLDPAIAYPELTAPHHRGPSNVIGPTPSSLRAHAIREIGGNADDVDQGRRSKTLFEYVCRRVLARRIRDA